MSPPSIEELKRHFLGRLWDPESTRGGGWRPLAVRALRIGHRVARDLTGGQLTLQAMSLVYTTLLALVPLLAVSFSVLKAFGVHHRTEPLLRDFLRPLGERGDELTRQIIEWVGNMQVGLLGGVGVVLLIYSVYSLVEKIETAFNHSWHIRQRVRLVKRFGDYLSFILVGPVLIFAVIGTAASVMKTQLAETLLAYEPLALLARAGGRLLPYVLAIAAFTLVYRYVPNTRVRLGSALIGATFAGITWQSLGWLFASFVASSVRFSGVQSGFAIVLMFMIWVYLNWLILLTGASVAFYHQHPEYLGVDPSSLRLSGRLREKLALLVMFLVGRHHFRGDPPWTVEALSQRLRLPSDAVGRVLDALERAKLLAPSGEVNPHYLPARALETVRLREVLDAVRSHDEGPLLTPARLPRVPAVERLEKRIGSALEEALGERTVRDLVLEAEAAPATSRTES